MRAGLPPHLARRAAVSVYTKTLTGCRRLPSLSPLRRLASVRSFRSSLCIRSFCNTLWLHACPSSYPLVAHAVAFPLSVYHPNSFSAWHASLSTSKGLDA